MEDETKLVKKTDVLEFIVYHGNKRMIKNWVNGFGDSFSEHFRNVPFGALKFKGEVVLPGQIIVRFTSGKYGVFEKDRFPEQEYYKF